MSMKQYVPIKTQYNYACPVCKNMAEFVLHSDNVTCDYCSANFNEKTFCEDIITDRYRKPLKSVENPLTCDLLTTYLGIDVVEKKLNNAYEIGSARRMHDLHIKVKMIPSKCCDNPKLKTYVGLNETFDYCEKCGKKVSP